MKTTNSVITKISVFVFIILALYTTNTYSQFKRIFSIKSDIPNGAPSLFSFISRENILLFACGNEIISKELTTGAFRRHTEFSTDMEDFTSLWRIRASAEASTSIIEPGGPVDANNCYVYGNSTIIHFTNLFTNPKADKAIYRKDIPEMYQGGYSPITGNWLPPDYFYAILKYDLGGVKYSITYFLVENAIIKIDFENPNPVLKKVNFPKYNFISDGTGKTELIFHPIDNTLWFKMYYDEICRYNITTDSMEIFDHNNLPLQENYTIIKYFRTGMNIAFFVKDAGLLKLLTFDVMTKEWKVEEIGTPPDSSVVYDATKQFKVQDIFQWPVTPAKEYAFVFSNSTTGNGRNFVIYNTDTKQWRDFIIPISVFNVADPANEYLLYPRQISWLESKKTIGILSEYFLIEYDPYVGIEETDEGIYQEIGIRKIYPNPAYRTATAEIMCYVQDRSKLDIGLYNLMGEKILDLSDNFEYSEATHTIYTTFNVPENISNGIYYLRVRNGTENRTQALVIGYK